MTRAVSENLLSKFNEIELIIDERFHFDLIRLVLSSEVEMFVLEIQLN